MAAIVPDHAFRLAGRARGVEDVERIGRRDRHAIGRRSAGDRLIPILVAAGHQAGGHLFALVDDAEIRFVAGYLDRLVQQRLVGHDPPRFEAAGGRDDRFRRGVVDPDRQFVGGEPAEHDGMDGAQPCNRKHGDRRFGDHRHIDDHPVALADAAGLQDAGEGRHGVAQFAIGEFALRSGDRAVVDQRKLVGPAAFDMAVHGVVAGVAFRPDEPAVEGWVAAIQHLFPRLVPVQAGGGLAPEALGVFQRALVNVGVGLGHNAASG